MCQQNIEGEFVNMLKLKKILYIFLIVVFTCGSVPCLANVEYHGVPTYTRIYGYPDFFVTKREARALVSRLIGVTDNMVKSDVADSVRRYVPEGQANAFYKEEYNYENLLNNALNSYDTIIKANGYKGVEELGENSGFFALNFDFIRPALLLQGVIQHIDWLLLIDKDEIYSNNTNYMYIMARKYGYIMNDKNFDDVNDCYRSLITQESLKHMIYAFLDSPVTYYYDEAQFLSGNTDPIFNEDKSMTYYALLKKQHSLKDKEEVYNYVMSIIRTEDAKRMDMIKSIDEALGLTYEKYCELRNEIQFELPYTGRSSDLIPEEAYYVSYAKYYYLDGDYPQAYTEIRATDYDDGFSWVERPGSHGFTIRAQEYVKVSELKECLTNYITKQNITPTKSLDEIFGDIDLDSALKKSDLERITNEFAESIGVDSKQS